MTIKYFFLLILFLLHFQLTITAQNTTVQTVKGSVLDKDLQTPLVGANVILVGSAPLLGATTDENGRFRLEKVPIGRQSFMVSFVGYEGVSLKNIAVIAGKETDLTVEMAPSVFEQNMVIVASKNDKRVFIALFRAVYSIQNTRLRMEIGTTPVLMRERRPRLRREKNGILGQESRKKR